MKIGSPPCSFVLLVIVVDDDEYQYQKYERWKEKKMRNEIYETLPFSRKPVIATLKIAFYSSYQTDSAQMLFNLLKLFLFGTKIEFSFIQIPYHE